MTTMERDPLGIMETYDTMIGGLSYDTCSGSSPKLNTQIKNQTHK